MIRKIINVNNKKSYNLKKTIKKAVEVGGYDQEQDIDNGFQVETPEDQFSTEQVLQQELEDKIGEKQRKIIFEYIQENFNSQDPKPLDIEIWQDPNALQYFKSIVNDSFGYNADQFLNKVENNTMQFYQQQQTQQQYQQQQQGADIDSDIPKQFYMSGEMQDMVDYLVKRRGIDNNMANEVAYEAIEYNLGEPKGEHRTDQRFNFFIYNPDYIPDNILDDLSEQFEKLGIEERKDFVKYISKRGGATAEKKELMHLLKDNYGNILLDILRNSFSDMTVKEWAARFLHKFLSIKQNVHSIDFVVSPEGGVAEKDLLEDEVNNAHKKLREEVGNEETEEINTERIISLFIEELLNDKLKKVQGLKNDIVNKMYNGDEKSENIADKIDFYIDAIINQFDNLFSLDSIGGKTDDITRKTIRNTRQYKNALGSLQIPKKIIQDVFGYIAQQAQDMGKEITQLDDGEIRDIVKNYNISNPDLMDWMPEWRKICPQNVIMERYKKIANLKSKIKELQKRGYEDGKSIINTFTKDDMEYFNDNLQEALNFINRTLGQQNIDEWKKAERHEKKEQEINELMGLRNTIKEIQSGEFDNSIGPLSDTAQVIDVINKTPYSKILNNNLESFEEQVNFVNDTLDKGEDEIKKMNKEMRKQYQGIFQPKSEFAVKAKDVMRNAYDIKKQDKYDDEIFRMLFSVISPHKSVKTFGNEGKGIASDGKTYTELYYDLIGEEIPEDVSKKIDINKKIQEETYIRSVLRKSNKNRFTEKNKEHRINTIKRWNIPEEEKQRQIEEVKNMPSLTPEQKKELEKRDEEDLTKVRSEIKFHRKLLTELNKYQKDKQKLSKLLDRKENIEDRMNNRLNKAYKRSKNKEGIPELTKKDNEMIDKDEKKIEEIKEKIKKAKKEIKEFRQGKFGKYASAIKNNEMLKIAYNYVINMDNEIKKLLNIKNNISNIKVSSNIDNVNNIIFNKIDKFNKIMDIILNN